MTNEEHAAPVVSEPSHEEVARQIADELEETTGPPRRQILQIVRAVGRTGALALLARTLEVEAQGGMTYSNGTHRRTRGGIFFHLAYSIGVTKTGEKLQRPRPPARKGQKPTQKAGSLNVPASQPANKPFVWEDRRATIEEIGDEKGKVTSVKITLIGRPGKWQQRGDCTVLIMQQTGEKRPMLPRGVPAPAQITTNYVVYVGAKQWKGVANAASDLEDALIVEGFPQIDPATGAISVFATGITSKKLQAAKRQAPNAR